MAHSILVVDEHPAIRYAVTALLREEGDLEVIAEAGGRNDALRSSAATRPDLVVIDALLSGGFQEGLDTIKKLAKQVPAPRILVYSGRRAKSFLLDLVEAGVIGYVSKDSSLDRLLHAIRAACGGLRVFVDGPVRGEDVGGVALTAFARHCQPLDTHRERLIIECVARGMTNREIAKRLSLAPSSIRHQLSTVFMKLGVKNRAEAAAEAARLGLTSPEYS
jgi:DNA-binding NarL/FixJ family response regulator